MRQNTQHHHDQICRSRNINMLNKAKERKTEYVYDVWGLFNKGEEYRFFI